MKKTMKTSRSITLKLLVTCTAIFFILQSLSGFSQQGIRALLIVTSKLGANYNFNIDDLEDYGFDLTVAGPSATVSPCPWASSLGLPPLDCDTLISEVADIAAYDALIIMPARWRDGNAYQELIGDPHVMSLIREADSLGKVIYSTCAGPKVIKSAGIVQGVRVTGIKEIRAEMIAAGAVWMGSDTLPVIDSNIVSSTRGMFYHHENMEAVTTALEISGGKKMPVAGSEWFEAAMNQPGGSFIWSKSYGGTSSEGASAITGCVDGGFLMAGYTWSQGSGSSDIMLVKTDGNGNQQWIKTIGGAGWEYAYGLCRSADGGYYIAGYTTSYGASSKDFLLVKTDEDGNEEWQRTFGGQDIDVGRSVAQSPDGSVLVCGYTQSYGNGEDDILLVKTDAAGNLKWMKTYGGNSSELGKQVLVNSRGNYVVLGSTGSWGAGNRDFWLACCDTSGSIIWSRTYGNDAYQESQAMTETDSHGYLMTGQSDIHGVDFLNMYLVMADSLGNLVWEKQIESAVNFYEYGRGVTKLSDGSFMICGNLKYPADRTNDLFVCKIDSSGNLLWSESFGGNGSDWGNAVCSVSGNDVMVAGHTFSFGAGLSDAWLVRVHIPYTGIGEGGRKSEGQGLKELFPNPFSGRTEIIFDVPAGGKARMCVLSSTGEVKKSFPEFHEGIQRISWDGRDDKGVQLPAGLYVFTLQCGPYFSSKKIIRLGGN
jgi:putative intracellular protease/amidase